MSPLGYHSPHRMHKDADAGPQVGTPGNPKTEAVGGFARKMRAEAGALHVKLPKAKGK